MDPFFSLVLFTSSLCLWRSTIFDVSVYEFLLFIELEIHCTSWIWGLMSTKFSAIASSYSTCCLFSCLLLELWIDVRWALSILLDNPLGSTSLQIFSLAVCNLLFNLSIEFQIWSIIFLISVGFIGFFFQTWLFFTIS